MDSEITRSDRVDAIDSDWGAYMRAAMTTVARVILRAQRVLSRTGWWARVVSAGGGCGLGLRLRRMSSSGRRSAVDVALRSMSATCSRCLVCFVTK